MKRVRDLPAWPPVGGGYDREDSLPSIQEVTIKEVNQVSGNKISFTCLFEKIDLGYDFMAPDEKTAARLVEILEDNVGKTLFSIEVFEIPAN